MARNQPDKPDWSNAETELPGVVLVDSTSEEGKELLASWEKPCTTVIFDTNADECPPSFNTSYGRAGR